MILNARAFRPHLTALLLAGVIALVSCGSVTVTRASAFVLLETLQAGAEREGGGESPDLFELGLMLCDEGRWAEALPVHRRIVEGNPFYAMGWMGLGWSLHYSGRYAEAIPAYLKALELGALRPHRIMLEIARCHAARGDKLQALDWFGKAMRSGLPNLAQARADKRLELLKDEPRFKELVADVNTSRMSRAHGWRYDLSLLSREIRRIHYDPYRNISRAELDAEVRSIHRAIPSLTDEEIAVRFMKLMRRLGDGHSYAEAEFQYSKNRQALPVRFSFFEEGLFIEAATPEHEDLLWARVLKFDRSPVEKVYEALGSVVPQDNPQRVKSQGPEYLRFPQVLKALGLADKSSEVKLTVIDRHGRERVAALEVAASPLNNWVRRPSDAKAELPLFARNPGDYYWFEYFPESRVLYFQYNGCQDKKGESIEEFAERLFGFVESHDVEKLVVDLRWNGGGNMNLSRPLVLGLTRAKQVNRHGRLFVIAGRHTFSAAMIFAEQLERFTDAIFVGEPTGSSPNFVGETNFLTLPYGKVRASISNLYWQNSTPTDRRIWIAPRLLTPPTFESYKNGRDPALEAILDFRNRP
jgi:tetratricopeptide (TPR) repeat protein